jgi:hypothetical protein
MRRVVYSPSINQQKEAEKIAIEVGLPIVVGDNQYTKNVEFDRTKVQILFIPQEKLLDHPNKAKKLFACPISYSNDWINFDFTIKCVVENGEKKIEPKISYMENHFLKYIVRFPSQGIWKIKIFYNEKVIDESEIEVV